MHAFRSLIEQEMDARGWKQADLVRAGGLSRQSVSKLLGDNRDVLPERPEDKTVDGLAKAFGLSRDLVLTRVGMAMGLPVLEPAVLYDPTGVSDADLLRELARRLEERGPRDAAPNTVPDLAMRDRSGDAERLTSEEVEPRTLRGTAAQEPTDDSPPTDPS